MKKKQLFMKAMAAVGLLLCLGLIMAGCGRQKADGSEREMEIQLFMKNVGIDEDCAEGIVDELHHVGALVVTEVSLVGNKRGYQVLAKDSAENTYYIGLGGMGYLEYIRKGTADGEFLYAAEDD